MKVEELREAEVARLEVQNLGLKSWRARLAWEVLLETSIGKTYCLLKLEKWKMTGI